jgi:hypothetical protein
MKTRRINLLVNIFIVLELEYQAYPEQLEQLEQLEQVVP